MISSRRTRRFRATVRPGRDGRPPVRPHNLRRWNRSGKEEAQIVDGKATATLPGAALAKLEKGSRVLQVALADAEEEAVCRALRLRGRVFANVLEAPGDLRAGDEIIITDLTPLQPEEAVSAHSEKGKWWWRPYSTPDGEQHHLVCVEEQDTAEPQSCIAPSIRLPLNLEGWYEIWVRTYRHDIQGGIDVRLSGRALLLPRRPSPDQHNSRHGAASRGRVGGHPLSRRRSHRAGS